MQLGKEAESTGAVLSGGENLKEEFGCCLPLPQRRFIKRSQAPLVDAQEDEGQ